MLLDNPTIKLTTVRLSCTPAFGLIARHVQHGIRVTAKSAFFSRLHANLAAAVIALTDDDLQRAVNTTSAAAGSQLTTLAAASVGASRCTALRR